MTHSLEDLKTRLDVSLLDMLSILRLSYHLLVTDTHEGCFFLLSLLGEGINSEIKQFKQFARYGGTLVIPALGKLRQDFKFQVKDDDNNGDNEDNDKEEPQKQKQTTTSYKSLLCDKNRDSNRTFQLSPQFPASFHVGRERHLLLARSP